LALNESKAYRINAKNGEFRRFLIRSEKLQFSGERMRKGSALDPPKNFLKKVLRNLKNFQKRVIFHQFSPTK
jgi:hypothetical protein